MPPETEAHPESINGRLVDYLIAQKDAILTEWQARVRGDPSILLTETLNAVALKNRLPDIFDDLTDTLRRYGSETVAEQTVKDAEQHGATRLRQSYELSEMLRELKHLRAILIDRLRAFDELNPDDGMAARKFTSTTLHGFLDEMSIKATEEYVSLQSIEKDRPSGAFTKW